MKNSAENIIVSHNCQSSSCNRWTVTGKVSDVIRTNGSTKPGLHFAYDAKGNRISKTVINKKETENDKYVTTYYVRDPQGNVLAVYERKRGETGNGTLTLAEQHLYGAGRLGMRKRDLALNATNTSESPATYYELTNHLGNVMAVISDEASATNEPMVVSLSDYYPYGMTEPGRSWNAGDYRFGYTGHEKENDLAEGVYTTEYRLLDTRLGRWLSVDPLFGKYPDMSAYNYCGGNPVALVDVDGDRPRVYVETNGFGHTFISVGEKGNFTVYTYGRYLGGAKGKSVGGSSDPTGRGCLIKLTGNDALKYIEHEKVDCKAKTFVILDVSDEKVTAYFEKMFSNGRKLNEEEAARYDGNERNYGSSKDVRVIDEYSLTSNNCTTKVNEGLIDSGSKVYDDDQFVPYNPWSPTGSGKIHTREHRFSPIGTQVYLEHKSQKNSSCVQEEK